jgi:hypothetical protein
MADAPSSGRVYPPPVLALYTATSTAAKADGSPITPGLEQCRMVVEALQAIGWRIVPEHDVHPCSPFGWIGEQGPEIATVDPSVFGAGLATAGGGALIQQPEGACICGPRGDGTGPYGGDPDPDCPTHGHVYGMDATGVPGVD